MSFVSLYEQVDDSLFGMKPQLLTFNIYASPCVYIQTNCMVYILS